MKTVYLSSWCLVILLGLSACSDPASDQGKATQVNSTTPPKQAPADPLTQKIATLLSTSSPDDVYKDHMMVRQWRAGGETKADKWPACEKVAKLYGGAASLKTLVGVKDALVAARVDDHVLCDQPTIAEEVKTGVQMSIQKIAPDMDPSQVVSKLEADPKSSKIDQCWLDSLRNSRQEKTPYDKAFKRADMECNKK